MRRLLCWTVTSVLVVLLCSIPLQGAAAQCPGASSPDADSAIARAHAAEAAGDLVATSQELHRAARLYERDQEPICAGSALIRIGWLWMARQQWDSALSANAAALPLVRARGGPRALEWMSLFGMATAHLGLGKADSALGYAQQALGFDGVLEGIHTAVVTRLLLGKILIDLDRPDSALVVLARVRDQAHALGARTEEGFALVEMGRSFLDVHQPDSARRVARGALAIFAGPPPMSAGEGRALVVIGRAFSREGHADSAFAYFDAGLRRLTLESDAIEAGSALYDVAHELRRINRIQAALDAALRARPLLRGTKNEAPVLELIGLLYGSQDGMADSALGYARAAERLYASAGNRRGAEGVSETIGRIFLARGLTDSALVYARTAWRLAEAGRDSVGLINAANLLGAVFNLQEIADSALTWHRLELQLARADRDAPAEAKALANVGATYSALALDRPELFDSAIAYFDSATARLEVLRRAGGHDENRVQMTEAVTQIYFYWALTELQAQKDPEGRAALAVVERGRAQALADLMRVTPPARAPRQELRAEATAAVRSATGPHGAVLSYLSVDRWLFVWIAQQGRPWDVIPIRIGPDSLRALVSQYRMALGVGTDRGPGRREILALDEPVRSGAAGMTQAAGPAMTQLGLALAELVLPAKLRERLGSDIRELTIIPHGPLALLSFASLPLPGDSVPLGARYAVRYAPSLATLAETQRRQAPASGILQRQELRRALVVGNPKMPVVREADGTSYRLGRLSGAEVEGQAVAGKLGAVALGGDSATESRVRARMIAAPVIHLATHGFAYSSEARVRESFVALAPDSVNDGLLTVGEMLDDPALALKADLVALSACQTGLGDLKQAEGTVGLQRAFLARGARSVLVSLWSVSDDATELLMRQFYDHWLDDRDRPGKAEALRRAEADVRSRPEYREPKYWAAFQLVGAD